MSLTLHIIIAVMVFAVGYAVGVWSMVDVRKVDDARGRGPEE